MVRYRTSDKKIPCRLNVESLEDRRVLSLLGLAGASQLMPLAPPAPAVVQIVAAPAEQSVQDAGQTPATISRGSDTLAEILVPITNTVSAAPTFLNRLAGEANVTVLAGEAAPSALPTIDTVGAVDHFFEAMRGESSGVAPDHTARGGIATELSLGLAIDLPIANVEVTVAPPSGDGSSIRLGVSAQVGSDTTELSSPNGPVISLGLNTQVTLEHHEGSRADHGVGVSIGASVPGSSSRFVDVSVGTPNAAGSGRSFFASLTPTVSEGPALGTSPLANLGIDPGRGANQPIEAFTKAGAGGSEIAATGLPPTGPRLNANPVESVPVEQVTFSPESSGLLTEATPFELAAMERALRQFLDQLDELRENVGAWLSDAGPLPWVFLSMAVAALANEILRRRLQQAQDRRRLGGKDGDEAMTWAWGFVDPRESS